MPRLFDAYVIVDWSAASTPVTGANSIWVGVQSPTAGRHYEFTADNPRTRLEARHLVADRVGRLIERGNRVLLGCDFAMGYPAGTAQRLGLRQAKIPAWQSLHQYLGAKVKEAEDNRNARFALAAEMNHAISKGPHPFWGAPARDIAATLSARKGDFSKTDSLAEQREAETWIKANFKANPKSVWQLLGAGAVGSQTLLGIAAVTFWRSALPGCKVWPFQTGLKALTEKDLTDTKCLIAEIYPSTIDAKPEDGEIFDKAQVRTLSNHLQKLDSKGELARAFAPPDSLDRRKIPQIIDEEGWILAK